MKRSPLKRKTKLRVAGKSSASEDKREIQSLLRQIVMKRDKGCILRMERCGNELDTPGVVFQADHLVTRANSATYADHRLVVCVCRGCHGWKHWHKEQYDALIKTILPEDTVRLWEKAEQSRWRPTNRSGSDWKLEIVALKQYLTQLT